MKRVEVVIHYPKSLQNREQVYFLAYGIEEEGLPFKLMESQSGSVYENADAAADASSLDVGIGIGDDWRIAIRHSRFAKGIYLFDIQAGNSIDFKAYGANAARLIKGVPFKEIAGG